jgi:hypothetical protein
MPATPSPIHPIYTAAYWEKAPSYDSTAFWKLVLKTQPATDPHLVIGMGAAGTIRCTRAYGEHRLDLERWNRREQRASRLQQGERA